MSVHLCFFFGETAFVRSCLFHGVSCSTEPFTALGAQSVFGSRGVSEDRLVVEALVSL